MNRGGRTRNDESNSTTTSNYTTHRGRGRGRGRSTLNSGGRDSSNRGDPPASAADFSNRGRQTPRKMSVVRVSKHSDCISDSDNLYRRDSHLPGPTDLSSDFGNLKLVETRPESVTPSPNQLSCFSASASASALSDPRVKELNMQRIQREHMLDVVEGNCISVDVDDSPALDNMCILDKPPLLSGSSDIKDTSSRKGSQCGQSSKNKSADSGCSDNSDGLAMGVPFDICPVRTGKVVTLKPPLHVHNRIKRDEAKRFLEGNNISVLRSGMLLLKKQISIKDQVKIAKTCRNLGVGSGGFYNPGYRDGGKMHLKMMCLGKNWDPETSRYGDHRSLDGVKPPSIPSEFSQMVEGAIQFSHSFLREDSKVRDVENELPSMSPNICIVNFYPKIGRLGLHQDKDESKKSLDRGLPVVSFSIGDSAEFLYGDQRDADQASKVILESGDVLIFGGKSRHIFHGVTTILPDTAPKPLLEEANLIPGRLNLTFREY